MERFPLASRGCSDDGSPSRSAGALSLALLFLALVTLGHFDEGRAWAHPNHGPTLGERYLKLDLADHRVRIVYGLTYGSRTAAAIRTVSDTNGDGVVDASEAEARGRALIERLTAKVRIEARGRELAIRWRPPFIVGLAGPGARGPITMEAVGRTELPTGTERIVVRDRAEFEGVYRTVATVATDGTVTLLRAGEGENPSTLQRRVAYLDLPEDGPPPPRIFTVVLRPLEPASQGERSDDGEWPSSTAWALAVVGGVALVGLIAFITMLVRRRGRAR